MKTYQLTEWSRAGNGDLVELHASGGQGELYLPKWLLEAFAWGILRRESLHISGPTGAAKTSMIQSVLTDLRNWEELCRGLGVRKIPTPRLFPIPVAAFDAPSEVYRRRALSGGATFDQPSPIVEALREGSRLPENEIPVLWLKELGRTIAAGVQTALIELFHRGPTYLPGGESIDGTRICWLADSNYAALGSSTHELVKMDAALARRFTLNLNIDYLQPEAEEEVVRRRAQAEGVEPSNPREITQLISIGQAVRERQQKDGTLRSVPPPTMAGFISYLRARAGMPHMTPADLLKLTFLGNATREDGELIEGILTKALGGNGSTSSAVGGYV